MTHSQEMTLMQRIGIGLLGLVLTACAVLSMSGCSAAIRDRGMLVTEDGLRAAAGQWDAHYNRTLARCRAEHAPMTQGAEDCFGPTYDADARVSLAVHLAVALLRSYWAARAAGESPDLGATLLEVQQILADLPAEAKVYFDRVKGIKQ